MLDENTSLFRVVHPKWIQNDRISSEVFRPFDDDELSMYNGNIVTAEEAFKHFTIDQGNKGSRVACVKVKTFQKYNLPVIDDGAPYPAHVTVDFSPICGNNPRRKISQCIKLESTEVYRVD